MFSDLQDHLLDVQACRDDLGREIVDVQAAQGVEVDVDEQKATLRPLSSLRRPVTASSFAGLTARVVGMPWKVRVWRRPEALASYRAASARSQSSCIETPRASATPQLNVTPGTRAARESRTRSITAAASKRPDLDEGRLQRTRELMNLAVRDAIVTGHEPLIGSPHLPHLDERHVLAAAIGHVPRSSSRFDLNDFPAEVLADWDVEARHPDDFLVDQFHLDTISVHKAIQTVADSWQRPPDTVDDVLDRLDHAGLPQTAAVLRR